VDASGERMFTYTIVENTAQITYTDDGAIDTASINNEGKLQTNCYVFIKQ
jgi:hypothetical protein